MSVGEAVGRLTPRWSAAGKPLPVDGARPPALLALPLKVLPVTTGVTPGGSAGPPLRSAVLPVRVQWVRVGGPRVMETAPPLAPEAWLLRTTQRVSLRSALE